MCGNWKKSEYQLMLYGDWVMYVIFIYVPVAQHTSVNVLCTPTCIILITLYIM